jgi:hypothetical protein
MHGAVDMGHDHAPATHWQTAFVMGGGPFGQKGPGMSVETHC